MYVLHYILQYNIAIANKFDKMITISVVFLYAFKIIIIPMFSTSLLLTYIFYPYRYPLHLYLLEIPDLA